MSNNTVKVNDISKGIVGLVLFILALYSPYYLLNNYRPQLLQTLFPTMNTVATASIIMAVTLGLVVISMLTVIFINNNIKKSWIKPLGILLLAVVAAVPALAILKDSTFNSLGIVYFISIIVASVSWASLNMIGTFLNLLKHK